MESLCSGSAEFGTVRIEFTLKFTSNTTDHIDKQISRIVRLGDSTLLSRIIILKSPAFSRRRVYLASVDYPIAQSRGRVLAAREYNGVRRVARLWAAGHQWNHTGFLQVSVDQEVDLIAGEAHRVGHSQY